MRTIGLLGATGYTGRLTAAEFVRRGVAVRLGARSAERLSDVPATADSEKVVVDTTRPEDLRRFLAGLDVVISTVGPFTTLGRPVVDAAVDAGVHYLDSTGEPAFMQSVYDAHRSAATAVAPACGYDYVPGDCAAAIAAAELGRPPDTVTVGYTGSGLRPTRGTARSIVEAVLVAPDPGLRRTRVGGRPAVTLPWGEEVTVPLWAPGARVTTAVTVAPAVAYAAQSMRPLAGPTLRTSGPLLRRLVERLPEGPSDEQRGRASTTVVATARSGGRAATVTVEVRDVYAFTAVALVECALRIDGSGPMAPSQLAEPRQLLDA